MLVSSILMRRLFSFGRRVSKPKLSLLAQRTATQAEPSTELPAGRRKARS